jgi:hypothetical protein
VRGHTNVSFAETLIRSASDVSKSKKPLKHVPTTEIYTWELVMKLLSLSQLKHQSKKAYDCSLVHLPGGLLSVKQGCL